MQQRPLADGLQLFVEAHAQLFLLLVILQRHAVAQKVLILLDDETVEEAAIHPVALDLRHAGTFPDLALVILDADRRRLQQHLLCRLRVLGAEVSVGLQGNLEIRGRLVPPDDLHQLVRLFPIRGIKPVLICDVREHVYSFRQRFCRCHLPQGWRLLFGCALTDA